MNCNHKTLGKILDKTKPTEFEIQSTIWNNLNAAGFRTRGEVTAKHFHEGRIRRCKFDLVVFKNKIPVAIIEVKRWGKCNRANGILVDYQSCQAEKYRTFGVPIIHCGHIENVHLVTEEIRRIFNS